MRYPIRAVARLTGISLDTLRAWERRYRAVEPERGKRGRLYSDDHVQRLVLLRETVRRGHPIGQVAAYSNEQLGELLDRNGASVSATAEGAVQQPAFTAVLEAVSRGEYLEADRHLGRLAALLGPLAFVEQIVLPLAEESKGRPGPGHWASAQRRVVFALLDTILLSLMRATQPAGASTNILIAELGDANDSIMSLAAGVMTAAGGLAAIYIRSVGLDAIPVIADRLRASAVLVSGTSRIDPFQEASPMGDREVWQLGGQAGQLSGATLVKNLEQLKPHLRRLGGKL